MRKLVSPIIVEKALLEPVKQYQEKRKYSTFTRAANELIRVGLEKVEEEKKNEGINTD